MLGKSAQHPSGSLGSDPKLVKARAIHQTTFEAFWERRRRITISLEELVRPLLATVSRCKQRSDGGKRRYSKSVQRPSETLRSDPKLVKARAIHQITFEAFWERLESTWERAVASPHRSRRLIHTYGLG